MHNELLHIGPLTVYGYGFMIAMGVLAAWFVAEQRARRLHLAYEHIFLSCSMVCHRRICFCKNPVLDYQLERVSPESTTDDRFRRFCGLWWDYRWDFDRLAVLQDKEAEIPGVF